MDKVREFVARLNANLTAFYLDHEGDYSFCGTCGPYDDRNPTREQLEEIITKTLTEVQNG